MPLVVVCPHCGAGMSVGAPGGVVTCPTCRRPVATGPQPEPPAPAVPADPFAGIPANGDRGRRDARRGDWPGPPPGWLVTVRVVMWGVIAVPAVLLVVLMVAAAVAGVGAELTPIGRVARAAEVVTAVGVCFAIDRLLSAGRY